MSSLILLINKMQSLPTASPLCFLIKTLLIGRHQQCVFAQIGTNWLSPQLFALKSSEKPRSPIIVDPLCQFPPDEPLKGSIEHFSLFSPWGKYAANQRQSIQQPLVNANVGHFSIDRLHWKAINLLLTKDGGFLAGCGLYYASSMNEGSLDLCPKGALLISAKSSVN